MPKQQARHSMHAENKQYALTIMVLTAVAICGALMLVTDYSAAMQKDPGYLRVLDGNVEGAVRRYGSRLMCPAGQCLVWGMHSPNVLWMTCNKTGPSILPRSEYERRLYKRAGFHAGLCHSTPAPRSCTMANVCAAPTPGLCCAVATGMPLQNMALVPRTTALDFPRLVERLQIKAGCILTEAQIASLRGTACL